MNITKPYKAATPEETTAHIKEILSKSGLPVKEVILGDDRMFFSCRISFTDDDDTSIGTNGKGMNRSYAMASGYAEFMERLQNRVIVYPNPMATVTPCRFFPDETEYRWTSRKEIEDNIKAFTPSTFPEEGIKADRIEGKSLPFYHVNTGKVENIPYSLIRWVNGSNGMSAGNILEESLIQGFCEIFERHALQKMYLDNIVPPDIPLKVFEGTVILERLIRMKAEYGMDFGIKDLSLGEGFPVLGLLVYSPDKTKYILQLGADLNPVTALERCFTEIFQGYTANTLCFENDVNHCERVDLFNEFKRSLTYGRGRLPKSFFTDSPSYSYKGHTTITVGRNFREDLNNICRWITAKGYDIYLRDNSFLGFKTTHIVVPGLSDIDKTFCRLNRRIHHMTLIENRENPLFNLRAIDSDECKATAEYLETLDTPTVDLFPRSHNRNNHVNRLLLLLLLYIKAGDKKQAILTGERYLHDCTARHKEPMSMIKALLQQLGGDTGEVIPARLSSVAAQLLQQPDMIFNAIPVPNCFNCTDCPISEGCRFPLVKRIEDFVQKAMAEYDFNQNIFSTILT